MIPIGDDNPRRTVPVITIILVSINVAAFFYELSLGPGLVDFINRYGAAPAELIDLFQRADYGRVFAALIVSMFLHGGWLHLGGNMLYLWVFGDNVEDRMGKVVYLLFYLASGILSMVAHGLSDPSSHVPAIGASGAVAAVLGAYIVLFPRARVTIIIPLFLFFPVAQVPAVFVLGFWFVSQIASGVLALSQASAAPVAWWAHIGGFAVGMALGRVLGGAGRPTRRYRNSYL